MIIKGYRVEALLKKVGSEIMADDVLGLAAQTAYYFFFSIFPLLLFAAPVLSVFGNSRETFDWIIGQLATTVPPDAIGLVRGFVASIVFTDNAPGLMSVGALLALWTGSNVFASLMSALNTAYNAKEERPWWKQRLIALVAVVVTGALMTVAATVMLAGPEIVNTVTSIVHLSRTATWIWMVLQYPIALGFVVAAMFLIYYVLPNIKQSKKQILIGAVAATVLWVISSLVFRVYVTNFASYNKTYGTIGAVIVLLTWMYITMLVVLVCGELNSELHAGTGAIEPRKGAVYEGRIVTAREPDKSSTERVEHAGPLSSRPS